MSVKWTKIRNRSSFDLWLILLLGLWYQ